MTGLELKLREGRDAFEYDRVSDPKSAKDGYGEKDQKNKNQICAKEMGYKIITPYSDPGVSGKAKRLPQRDKMMADIGINRNVGALFIRDIDRYGRNFRELLNLYYDLCEMGVRLIVSRFKLDLSVPFIGEIFVMLLGWMADKESTLTKERTDAGKVEALKEKTCFIGNDKYGYYRAKFLKAEKLKKDKVVFQEAPKEKEAYLTMVDLCLNGNMSLSRIAEELTGMDIMNREGNPFVSGTIGQILRSECYATGKLYCKDEEFDCPKYIDMATWQKLQKKMDAAVEAPKGNVNPALCLGMIFCLLCNKAFGLYYGRKRKGDGGRTYHYFDRGIKPSTEERKLRGKKKCMSDARFRIEAIDDEVWEKIMFWIVWPEKHVKEYFKTLDKGTVERLEKELKDKDKKIAKKNKGIEIGTKKLLDPDLQKQVPLIKKQIKLLEAEVDNLEKEKAEIETQLRRYPSMDKIIEMEKILSIGKMRYRMDQALRNFSTEEKRMVLSWFFPQHERDEEGNRYGVYIRPRYALEDYDEPNDKKELGKEAYNATGKPHIELRGLFNVDNARRLIEKLRGKKGESEFKNHIANFH